jgi:hypothetical protein
MDLRKEIQVALNNCQPNTNRVYKIEAIAQKYAEFYHALQLQQTGVMARCNMSLIGKELNYISPITKAKQPFKVSDVFVNIFIQGLKERQVYAEVFAVSEKGNKYKIDEFSEVQV